MKLRGNVTKVFFASPDGEWMAGAMKDTGGTFIKFKGKVCANLGDDVELEGAWVTDPKYGRQFDATGGRAMMDETPDGVKNLLASCEEFKGIGPVRANNMVDAAFSLADGVSFTSTLTNRAEDIALRSGVSVDLVVRAASIWKDRASRYETLAELVEQGWTNAQASRLFAEFGVNAPSIVRRDPYMLIGRFERFGFRTVDAIGLRMGTQRNDPARAQAGVAFCLDRETSNGHTWVEYGELIASATDELQPDTLEGEDSIVEALDIIIATGLAVSHLSPDGETMIAPHRLAEKEIQVFERLGEWMRTPTPPLFESKHMQPEFVATLNEGQRSALFGIAHLRAAVISGAAGTGKTYTMKAIVDAAQNAGVDVALCAPTGKAAKKLSRSTNYPASTIHRLLEPTPNLGEDKGAKRFVFKRDSGHRLDQRLVIVDEFSMCDVKLFYSLMRALPEDAHLLLVGDHNQIPSVGAGAILRDILGAGAMKFPKALHVLSRVVRQAGTLAQNTTAILDGIVVPTTTPSWAIVRSERGHARGIPGIVGDLVEAIETSPEPLEPFRRALDPAWDIQVISPMRKGPHGVYALNVELQALRQRMLGNMPPPAVAENKQPRPMVGDRVIWTKNDYDLEMFNGTQAIVLEIKKAGTMKLLTEDDREVEVSNEKRINVELAYALTIHKCQGSQWPCVIMVGSSSHFIMHDRNLLYTGASRAAESLTIVGDWKGIRSFASRRRSHERRTLGKYLMQGWTPSASIEQGGGQ